MAELRIEDDQVVVALNRWEKLGAVRVRNPRFSRAAVRDVHRAEHPFAEVRGFRLPGTSLPRVVALGTWRERGSRDFLALYRGRPAVVVALDPTKAGFERVIVSTNDPAGVMAQVGG